MLRQASISIFLATARADDSRAFYADILNLELVEDNDFAIVFKLKGAELRVSKVPQFKPQEFTVLDWQVEDIHATVAHLKEQGISFINYDFIEQDSAGIWTIPIEGTQIAWFHDPDKNVVSISQRA